MWTRAPALITTIMVLGVLIAAVLAVIVAYQPDTSSHARAITVVSTITPATPNGYFDM